LHCLQRDASAADEDSNKLGLANVGGVFVVLIAGTLTAFFVAVLELLWNCRKIAVQEKVRTGREWPQCRSRCDYGLCACATFTSRALRLNFRSRRARR
jgi:hypothetical protein